MIGAVDDHEFADGAWSGGASEHREERDGAWADRLATAFRAREEWLPVRRADPSDPSRVFRTIALGTLADLFILDTRSRRCEPCPAPAMRRAIASRMPACTRRQRCTRPLCSSIVGRATPLISV